MKNLAKTLIALAAIAVSGAASAVTINSYTFDGTGVGIIFNGNPEGVGAGEITVDTSIGTFATYCVELTQGLPVPNPTYSFGPYASDWISRLVAFGGFYGGSDQSSNQVDTTTEKTAFQLAIWEAVYDSAPGDLSTGQFQVASTTPSILAQANAYLAGAAALPETATSDRPRNTTSIEARLTAADVAEQVLDAVRTGRFWILTHQEYRPVIVERAQGIGTDAQPESFPVW